MRFQKIKPSAYQFGEIKTVFGVHQKIVIKLAVISFIVLTYDTIFELMIHLLHRVFESTEHVLDLMIEGLLETSTHETQIIVFYILLLGISYGLYRVYRNLPRWYCSCKQGLLAWVAQQQTDIVQYWQELPLMGKIKAWTLLLSILLYTIFFGF
jgi:hypothetical protein